jgi:predicted  nucleic acid-binding Zn-ribbon protein
MAWYRNFYHCTDCGTAWDDEWSCCCDDECPNCGSRNWSPYASEDLSVLISRSTEEFIVLLSPREVEEDKPRYRLIATLKSEADARALAKRLEAPSV